MARVSNEGPADRQEMLLRQRQPNVVTSNAVSSACGEAWDGGAIPAALRKDAAAGAPAQVGSHTAVTRADGVSVRARKAFAALQE